MPFGKYKGETLTAVPREEPSYLCWLMEKVEGCMDVKKAVAGLPGFREEWEKYYVRKHRKELTTRKLVEETVRRMFGSRGQPVRSSRRMRSRSTICATACSTSPCRRTRQGWRSSRDATTASTCRAARTCDCEKAGDERYRFQGYVTRTPPVQSTSPGRHARDRPVRKCRSDILEQMDYQMSYCGEGDGDDRDAKFSETRRHIQRTIGERSPS